MLEKENRPKLFKYIWGVLNKTNCHLYRINGVEDHLHIVTHIHPRLTTLFYKYNCRAGFCGFGRFGKEY